MPPIGAARAGIYGGVDAIPASVLDHQWLHDEGLGTTLNDSEGDIDGTINGATWQTGAGTNDTYLLYDGTNDYSDFNNPGDPVFPATGDWTFFAWVRVDDNTVENVIYSQFIEDAGNGRMLLRTVDTNSDQYSLFLGNDSTQPTETLSSTSTITQGVWDSIAARRNGNTFELFVNGQPEDSLTDSGTRSILQTGNIEAARSGSTAGYNQDLTGYFDGGIDRVWMSANAVSDADILDWHDATKDAYV